MKTRCKHGDLAFIRCDEIGCEANIGRVVVVHGPVRQTLDRGAEWFIVPVNPSPFNYKSGETVFVQEVTLVSKIRHSDDWLTPIRGKRSGKARKTEVIKKSQLLDSVPADLESERALEGATNV